MFLAYFRSIFGELKCEDTKAVQMTERRTRARAAVDELGGKTEVEGQLERDQGNLLRSSNYGWKGQPFYVNREAELRAQAVSMLERRAGPLRLQDFGRAGFDPHIIRELVRDGFIQNPFRGIYVPNGEYDRFKLTVAALATLRSDFVLGLQSAAQFHGLLDQVGPELHVVLPAAYPLKPLGEYQLVLIRWAGMQPPTEPVFIPDDDLASLGSLDGMSELEITELYFGIRREIVYNTSVRVTTPSRTVCDLLRYRHRRLGRERFPDLEVDDDMVFDSLKTFSDSCDLEEVRIMAERLDCLEDVSGYLAMAQRFRAGMR